MPKGKISIDYYQTTFCSSLCKYVAKGEKGINLHLKYTHNIENFKQSKIKTICECGICGKTFKKDINLRKHVLKNHRFL